jgi:hypothetical protein
VTIETLEALVFLRGFKGGGYAEVNSERELSNRMQTALDDLNADPDFPLDIVLFSYVLCSYNLYIILSYLFLYTSRSAVHQASRVARVFGLSRGSTLLLGRLGRGRRAIVRLAAHFCGHRLIMPSSSASYCKPIHSHSNFAKCGLSRYRDSIENNYLLLKKSVKIIFDIIIPLHNLAIANWMTFCNLPTIVLRKD